MVLDNNDNEEEERSEVDDGDGDLTASPNSSQRLSRNSRLAPPTPQTLLRQLLRDKVQC